MRVTSSSRGCNKASLNVPASEVDWMAATELFHAQARHSVPARWVVAWYWYCCNTHACQGHSLAKPDILW